MNPTRFMSEQELRAKAPSIYATEAWGGTSDKYLFIPTINVLEALADEGFFPVRAAQSRTRIEGKREFTKHSIRLRRADALGAQIGVGDVFPEVILTNSHDGASAYRLDSGLFRLVCSNGMTTGESFPGVSVRHSGRTTADIIDGCIHVADDAVAALDQAKEWSGIQLSRPEQLLLAGAVVKARYGDEPAPIEPARLLTPRRWQDKADDLWTVTNRIQEATIKGGTRGIGSTGRRMTTRGVTSISEDARLNRAIMTLAEQFAQLKATH